MATAEVCRYSAPPTLVPATAVIRAGLKAIRCDFTCIPVRDTLLPEAYHLFTIAGRLSRPEASADDLLSTHRDLPPEPSGGRCPGKKWASHALRTSHISAGGEGKPIAPPPLGAGAGARLSVLPPAAPRRRFPTGGLPFYAGAHVLCRKEARRGGAAASH